MVIAGASSGFGKGAAHQFAARGASVVLAARRDTLLEELASECEAALAQGAVSRFGRLDIWVNVARSGALGLFEKVPPADHVQVIQTDLLGTLYGSCAAIRQFKQQDAGALINVASVIGKKPSRPRTPQATCTSRRQAVRK